MSCPVSSTTSRTSSQEDTIIVSVRIRPENAQEHGLDYPLVVQMIDSKMLSFDPKPEQDPYFGPPVAKKRVKGRHKRKDLTFGFDNVFGESSTQREVFEATTKKVLPCVLDGINCSIFAYGATGAGKTHTMLGTPEQPGIIYQTMKELYFLIDEKKNEISCDIAVTYLEIYNENIYDLLKDEKRCLPLREDSNKKSPIITGISYTKPTDAQDLLHILSQGNKRRTQHPTDANAQSSRSHAVFQVYIHQKPRAAGTETEVTVAKLSLIDLAGSERATVTTNSGVRLREGANINRSLLALGNVINALASNKGIKSHIPYRDSKLTRLLKDSLGGNCRTVMIANISPSGCSFEDTYNTLRYADRAKQIKVKTNRNVVNVQLPMHKYTSIIDDLRLQVKHLQEELRKPQSPAILAQTILRMNGFKGTISQLFQSKLGLDRKQRDADNEITTSMVSTAVRVEEAEWLQMMNSQDVKQKVQLINYQEKSRERESELQKEIETLEKSINNNSSELAVKYAELTNEIPNDAPCKEILHENSKMSYELAHLKFENGSLYHQNKLLYRSLTESEAEINHKSEMITNQLNLISSWYTEKKIQGTVSDKDDEVVVAIIKGITKQKEVSWADQVSDTPASRKRAIFSALQNSPLTPNSNRKTLSILSSSTKPTTLLKPEAHISSTHLPSTPVQTSSKALAKTPLINNFFTKPLSLFPGTSMDIDLDPPHIQNYTLHHATQSNDQVITSATKRLKINSEGVDLFKPSQLSSSSDSNIKESNLDSTFDIGKPKAIKRHFSNLSPTLRPRATKRFASEPLPSSLSIKMSDSLRRSRKVPTYAQLTIAAKSKYRKPVTSITSRNIKNL
ncbi:Kinesin-like protein KIF18A-like [Oopsacas minuta]|uniref:Kinesin-like protein n=1 Tax=Oopsacas minuta TaxID=111878 RepID=A0AAV7KB40_9METZ|nr:Kinesin-like protein KIF18A-like [Oopsacas minuta]